MRYPILDRTLLFLVLAVLLVVGGPIACSQDETAEESATEVAETEGPNAEAPGVPATPLAPEEIPEVVARLNGAEISKQELLTFAGGLQQRLAQSGVNPGPATAEFYRSALDQLMGAALLYESAVANGQAATAEEVNEQLQTVKSRFPSQEAFELAMSGQGVTEEMMRKEIERGISVQRLIDEDIATQIALEPNAERAYYDANLDQMQQPEQVHVSHILVSVDEGATEEARTQAREQADGLLGRALAGEDFATLARENSDDPGSAPRGGDISWIARGQTVPPFEQAAFSLQPGQLSGVVESPFGYHIIRLEERRAATTMEFEQVTEGIRQMLLRQEMESAIDSRIGALRAAADVEIFL